MSALQIKFPRTHEELIAMGQGGLLRFPAGFAEYWELLREAQHKADYSNGEIIATSTVYERPEAGPQWINTDYSRPEDAFLVGGQLVKLEDIYRKSAF